eukprot:533926-Pyramimonas_sp.AAC.1
MERTWGGGGLPDAGRSWASPGPGWPGSWDPGRGCRTPPAAGLRRPSAGTARGPRRKAPKCGTACRA